MNEEHNDQLKHVQQQRSKAKAEDEAFKKTIYYVLVGFPWWVLTQIAFGFVELIGALISVVSGGSTFSH